MVGVIYGNHDVAIIEDRSYIDPNTGDRVPESQRLISYALAHITETLWELKGTATQNLPLREYALKQDAK